MAIITYETLQQRIDYLQQMEYMLPNAFYPTVFIQATNDAAIYKQIEWNHWLTSNPSKSMQDIVKEEQKQAATGMGEAILQTSEDLALLEKIDGSILKFMDTPYESKGGVLDTGVTKDSTLNKSTREVKITFKVPGNLSIYNSLLNWKENWTSSTLEHRYLKTRSVDKTEAVKEGYLGLSYVHIKYDGSVVCNAHISLFGLIPKNITFANSIGPSESVKNVTTIITCTVASGLLMIANGTGHKTHVLA